MDLLPSKILTQLVLPPGQNLLLFLAALSCAAVGYRRVGRAVAISSALLLYLYSMPFVAGLLERTLEDQYAMIPASASPTADAAIVLGGLSGQLKSGGDPQVNDSADRLFHAARLFKAGKVQMVVVSGGNLSWDSIQRPEGEVIADLLVELGVPRDHIVMETTSRTTYENALETRKLWDQLRLNSALLVTSSWHMPRAMAVYRARGMNVLPSPTDSRVNRDAAVSSFAFLPDAGALALSALVLKEWIGLAMYRVRGWT
ncbi:MAG: YdcF family protein [Hyphomicrobiales bacterium]